MMLITPLQRRLNCLSVIIVFVSGVVNHNLHISRLIVMAHAPNPPIRPGNRLKVMSLRVIRHGNSPCERSEQAISRRPIERANECLHSRDSSPLGVTKRLFQHRQILPCVHDVDRVVTLKSLKPREGLANAFDCPDEFRPSHDIAPP